MKFKIAIIAALFAAVGTVLAQTNTIPSAVNTIGGWLTSENTNLFFQDAVLTVGPVNNTYATASETAAYLDLWRGAGNSVTNHSGGLYAGIETRIRNSSVAGAFVSEAFGGNFGYCQNDVKLGVYADGIYRSIENFWGGDNSRAGAEFGVQASKLMSSTAGVSLFVGYQTGLKTPIFGGELNLTFGNGSGFLGMF
jgi:hypothetical protein